MRSVLTILIGDPAVEVAGDQRHGVDKRVFAVFEAIGIGIAQLLVAVMAKQEHARRVNEVLAIFSNVQHAASEVDPGRVLRFNYVPHVWVRQMLGVDTPFLAPHSQVQHSKSQVRPVEVVREEFEVSPDPVLSGIGADELLGPDSQLQVVLEEPVWLGVSVVALASNFVGGSNSRQTHGSSQSSADPVQLLQVSGKDEVSFLLGNVAVEGPLRVSNEILGKLLVDESQDWVADSNDEVEEVVACLVSHNSCMLQLLLVAQLLGQGLDEGLSN